jgi:hypothetical protein
MAIQHIVRIACYGKLPDLPSGHPTYMAKEGSVMAMRQ